MIENISQRQQEQGCVIAIILLIPCLAFLLLYALSDPDGPFIDSIEVGKDSVTISVWNTPSISQKYFSAYLFDATEIPGGLSAEHLSGRKASELKSSLQALEAVGIRYSEVDKQSGNGIIRFDSLEPGKSYRLLIVLEYQEELINIETKIFEVEK